MIILLAAYGGFGHPTFFDWLCYQDLDEFEAASWSDYQING
jgi:hypothetical protein